MTATDVTQPVRLVLTVEQAVDRLGIGRVTVGVRDDGRPDRRHVIGSRADVTRKVRALEKDRDGGSVRRAGRTWTVEQWLTHWVENIVAPFVREALAQDSSVNSWAVASTPGQ